MAKAKAKDATIKGTTSFGKKLLQASLALILIITGLLVFTEGHSEGMIKAISGVFGNATLRDTIAYILAFIEIISGVLLLLDFLLIKQLDKFDDFALLLVMIAWCVFIVLVDIISPFTSNAGFNFLRWLSLLAQHVLVLAGMIIVKARI